MNPSLGLFHAVTAAATYGLMSFLVHWNPSRHPVEQLIFWRGVLSILCLLPFAWRGLGHYFRRDAATLWIRALAGSGGVLCYFYALQGTSSANANLVFSSSPVFVGLFAWILFRERLSAPELAGIACIVFGNFLLYLPNRGSVAPWVWAVGVGGALFASIAYLSLGAATKRYSMAVIVLGFAFVSAFVAWWMPGPAWLPLSWEDAPFLFVVSGLGLLSQISATLSFVHLKSSVATAIGRSSILFSGLLDVWIAHYHPHTLEWISYVVVLLGIFLAHRLPLPRLARKSR